MSKNVKQGQNFSKIKSMLINKLWQILLVHKLKLISKWQEIMF